MIFVGQQMSKFLSSKFKATQFLTLLQTPNYLMQFQFHLQLYFTYQ